jgi:hypothetical protein
MSLPARKTSIKGKLIKPKDIRLSMQDRFRQAIRTGLRLIPCGIGSAIDTAYFGTIEARRVKKTEAFLAELAKEIQRVEDAKVDHSTPLSIRIPTLVNKHYPP